jgi:pimeloyl-ACP methyl ester carboxylesterase
MSAPVRPKPPANFEDPLRPRNPLVTHRFLLGGVGIMILASLGALYFAIALLFWQGQWQLIFHPSHIVASTPASKGVPFEDVRFDATETGQTRLDGWWIPADPSLPHQPAAMLYLHEARGSLYDALPDLIALHTLGYDIFAFDPRGFGKSQWVRPSEKRWIQDSDAALYYLASVRHIGPSHLVLVGRGLGGTVGAGLTLRHAGLSSLVMIDPQPPTLHLLEAPRWTHILPVRLLAHDHFDPRRALSSTALDKLFLLPPNGTAPAYIAKAAQPAVTVHSTALDSPDAVAALRQFFAQSHAAKSN